MGITKITLVSSLLLWTIPLFATVYENAEDKTTIGWITKNKSIATIKNVYDTNRKSRVIRLKGDGKETNFRLGSRSGRDVVNNWNNKTENILQWSMKSNQPFRIYIPIVTKHGSRFLTYTNYSKDIKGEIRGKKVHYGLGEESIDGTWHTFTRDLEMDWNSFKPNNPFIGLNGFFINGSCSLDDIITKKTDNKKNPAPFVNYSSSLDDNTTKIDVEDEAGPLENLIYMRTDSNITKKVKILGIGSGGSHHLLFHHSDGKTVIECGDMGALSISHDGGKSFQPLISSLHAKDINKKNKHTLPILLSIVEHPINPDWLFGVATYGVISFSTDRGKTWHSKDIGCDMTNKIIIRNEGNKIIAYFASGYKLGLTKINFNKLGAWVDITDIPHNIISFRRGKEYNFIRYRKDNPTGYKNKYYYGDMVRLGSADNNKLFVAGKGGLFVCEGDPKNDKDWKNITNSIFSHKDGVFPIDHAVTIGDKLYVLAYGDNHNTEHTAGVYVHRKNDISNGKYNFTRIYKGLNLKRFNYSKSKMFERVSGGLLKHQDTSNGKTYLYLFMQDVVYRLDIGNHSRTFKRITKSIKNNTKNYSNGFILGQRNTSNWSSRDNGSYTSFNESEEFGTMTFGTSYFPSFRGLNKVYSSEGNIYVSNTIEIKVSKDNGKTFNSYISDVKNDGSVYDGKIKEYYGYIGLYEDGYHDNHYITPVTPTDDALSFWWSSIKNRGMDNMVSTDVAINPNNPKEMMQSYMDSAAFFSNDLGNSWHYTAGLKGILGDVFWTQWIKDAFYAQDNQGIYRFNKSKLKFEKLDDLNIYKMSIDEAVRVRRYYDKNSDTLVLAGYQEKKYHKNINTIWVIKHFTDDNLRELVKITDSRGYAEGIRFDSILGVSRSFKDVYCDSHYVYAINSELGIIKMPLNNLPLNYNNYSFGLDKNESIFSGLFDKKGGALLATVEIDRLNSSNRKKVERDYAVKYFKLIYNNKPFKLKNVNLITKRARTVIPRGKGLIIDSKSGVMEGNGMLTLLGIDPKNKNRILASIASTRTTIESKNGGHTWSEFLPQISGNAHRHQAGNAIFAPNNSLYDVTILGAGSAYGVLKK